MAASQVAGAAQAVVGQLPVAPSMLPGGPFEVPLAVKVPGDVDRLEPGVTQLAELGLVVVAVMLEVVSVEFELREVEMVVKGVVIKVVAVAVFGVVVLVLLLVLLLVLALVLVLLLVMVVGMVKMLGMVVDEVDIVGVDRGVVVIVILGVFVIGLRIS